MSNLLIQIKDKHGIRLERLNWSEQALSIGRDWHNDVVLLDEYVDAQHLHLGLTEEGEPLLTDTSSTNGSFLRGKRLRQARKYGWGDVIRIGDTDLQIYSTAQEVEPTKPRSAWFRWAHKLSSPASLVFAGFLALSFYVLDAYLSASKPIKLQAMVFESWPIVVSLLLITVFFGLLAKLFRGESNFSALWLLVCYALVGSTILEFILTTARFNIQDFHLGRLVQALSISAFILVLLLGLITFTLQMSNRARWMASAFVSVLVLCILLGNNLFKEEHELWRASTQTEQTTLPPAFLLRPATSLDDYQQAAQNLFDQVRADSEQE